MKTEEKQRQSRRWQLAWALWAFWGSDDSMIILRRLDPSAGWQDLGIPFKALLVLPDDLMEDLYARLHSKGTELDCKLPAILRDLHRALPRVFSED